MSSPTQNRYKTRSFQIAAATIEELDFTVRHGDELKEVCLTPPVPSFAELAVDLVFVL